MLSFEVKKLFGKFDYKFKLNESGITILTGPNGFGKTTILKCLDALTDIDKVEYFDKLEFEEIQININSNSFILLKDGMNMTISYNKDKVANFKDAIKFHGIETRKKNYLGIIYTTTEVFNSKEDEVKAQKAHSELQYILNEVKKNIEKIYYIRDDRLFNKQYVKYYKRNNPHYIFHGYDGDDNNKYYTIIDSMPDKLKSIIDNSVNEYYNNSNQLDSTYPTRLFKNKDEITNREFQDKKNDMNKKLAILYDYGLFSNKDKINFKFDEKYAGALKVYFDDFDKKYSIYKELIEKLDTFTNIVNNKLLYKKIKISKEYGIQIFSDNNNEIELNDLSSGEKQEIILFFELIFSTDESLMILIDEPELSLHVAWQKKFINDLFNIIKNKNINKNINIIIATHSPYIIGKYEENQIDLGELHKNAK